MYTFMRVVSSSIEPIIFSADEGGANCSTGRSKGKSKNSELARSANSSSSSLQLTQKGMTESGQTYWDVRCEPELYKKLVQLVADASQGIHVGFFDYHFI